MRSSPELTEENEEGEEDVKRVVSTMAGVGAGVFCP